MTRPIPMSDLVADDLLVDRVAHRQFAGDDPVAGLLAAVADYADRPLGTAQLGRRSPRHRVLFALAAFTIGASGAGVAAAVGTPDGPPDLPPRVAPSYLHQPAPTPAATFGLAIRAQQVIVLAPDGTRVTSLYRPTAWSPMVPSQTSFGRFSASEISRSGRADLLMAGPALDFEGDQTQEVAVHEPRSGPRPAVKAGDGNSVDRVQHRPMSIASKPAPKPAAKPAAKPADKEGAKAAHGAPAQVRGKSAQAPGQTKPDEPGNSGQAPAQAPGQAPGQTKPDEPGNSAQAPGQTKPDEPGNSGQAPAQAPGQTKPDEPGSSAQAPGQTKPDEPGSSAEAPGQAEPDEPSSPAQAPGASAEPASAVTAPSVQEALPVTAEPGL